MKFWEKEGSSPHSKYAVSPSITS